MTTTLGYTIFYVDDVGATLDFFTKAFGFERRLLTPEGDYGELETGATVLAFVVNALAHANLDDAGGFEHLNAGRPPVGASITLVTDDVPAAVERAVEHGAVQYTAPVDKPWGQTVAYLRDANGILIEVATPVGG